MSWLSKNVTCFSKVFLSRSLPWICLHIRFIFPFSWFYLYFHSFPVLLSTTVESEAVIQLNIVVRATREWLIQSSTVIDMDVCSEGTQQNLQACVPMIKSCLLSIMIEMEMETLLLRRKKTLLRTMWTSVLQKGQCAKAPAIRLMAFPKSLAHHLPLRLYSVCSTYCTQSG